MIAIDGYDNKYFITEDGNVFSAKSNRFLSKSDNGKGYLFVGLYKSKKTTQHYIHRLVAKAYIANTDKNKQVNHKDGNKSNNNKSNLEWATRHENMNHAVECGLSSRGTKRKNNKTGYVGVHLLKNGKYQANIKVGGKSKTIGYFDDAVSCAIARDKASLQYHGDTGKLNFKT